MTTFPNSPSPGDQVVFNETTFEWDGSRWVALGSISVGPAGPTGPTGPVGDYVETFNGLTGTVDTSSLTLHVVGISSDGGITAAGDSTFYANNLTVTSSSGDVTFTLEADSDNDIETDNPVIVLKQDGGVIQPKIGVGGSSSTFTNQKDNGLFLNHSSGGSTNMWIQLATNNTARLTVDGNGNVGIGNATPTEMLDVAELAKFDGGITLGSGITFPDGTYQDTAATSITDYVESFNGATGAVQGVSSVNGNTGGITAASGVRFSYTTNTSPSTGELTVTASFVVINETSAGGIGMTGAFQHFVDVGGGQLVITSLDGDRVFYAVNVTSASDIGTTWRFGRVGKDKIDTANFINGEQVSLMFHPNPESYVTSVNGATGAVTTTVTSSYAGHIYAPSEGTYYLDPRAPIGRTITEFYAICGTGGISADLYNSGATVGSLNVTPTGATASLSNTSLAQDGTLELVTSNYSACYDFRFAVRYTQ